jgi:hypothetical protein
VSVLHHISNPQRFLRGSVVFVHGLSGDPFETWRARDGNLGSWLEWLSEDLPEIMVYSLAYDADASNWFGHAMQLPDRATDVLAELVSQGLAEHPIIFVAHSLGGLVVKQVLRIAADHRGRDTASIFDKTRGVVFLGTPNVGSHLANWADRFRWLLRPSEATGSLNANDAYLRDLNMWYRDHSVEACVETMVFFETKPTKGAMVVEAMSADPGLAGVRPIPIDSDHISICKPAGRDTTLYRTVHRFIDEMTQPGSELLRRIGSRDERQVSDNVFDVFISHSSAQKAWVEALAHNLQLAGKSVFLDLWRLVPGRDWVDGLRSGLASCRSAILVVSPEALQSGWVGHEYEILKRRQLENQNFIIVPVIYSGVDGNSPFSGSIQWVDFRDPLEHLRSFARLLAGLEGRAPGPNPSYDTKSWIPLPNVEIRAIASAEQETIAHACDKLFNAPAVVILAQQGLGSAAISREIKKRAAERFGEDTVIQVTPSYVTPEDGLSPYFESLLAQIDLSTDAASSSAFQSRLAQKLDSGEPMCLLLTGIENSPRPALEMLCGSLRVLNERYNHFRVLMYGGERLCEMRYARGRLSYLSHAEEELWPEPGVSDILTEASSYGCGNLDQSTLNILQELTGGHFGILRELLGLVKHGEQSRDAFADAVMDSPTIWAAVAPFRDSDEGCEFLAEAARGEDLGKAERFIKHEILRHIYWSNLITRRKSGVLLRLVWRSPTIQEAVRRIVSGD